MFEEKEIEFQNVFKIEVQELRDFMLSSRSENRTHQKSGKWTRGQNNWEVRNVESRECDHP